MHNPRVPRWNVILKILRYLKKYHGQGFIYNKHKTGKYLRIHSYVNADWEGSIFDGKFTSGYLST